ncbi:MAG: hypothetical protein B7733_00025 [Myxococcales bacterium FL481]|nr:MAG: hypothetical protein B7733_00025 [Myxococcales bacterium FL481]
MSSSSAAQAHAERPLYLIATLRLPRATFTADDMAFLGAWNRVVASEQCDAESIVRGLYAGLRGHGSFRNVCRVCLARCTMGTHQLEVLASINGPEIAENTMQSGYSCFVRSDSSLLALREGTLRIYDDASRVSESFAAVGKPVQRSIARIGRMGIKSGVCMPLRVGVERGFLFLNSAEPGEFSNLSDTDCAVLSLSASLAKLALSVNGQLLAVPPKPRASPAKPFSGEHLAEALAHRFAVEGGLSTDIEVDAPLQGKTLVAHENLAELLVTALCSATDRTPDELRVSAVQRDDFAEISVSAHDTVSPPVLAMPYLQRLAALLGYRIDVAADCLAIRFPIDAPAPGADYSV